MKSAQSDLRSAIISRVARAGYAALTLCLVCSPVAAKDSKPVLVKYQKDSGIGLGAFGGKLLHSYGYKDEQLANGHWLVTGQAKSDLIEHSQYIALYRASEIAVAQNKPFVRVLTVNGRSLSAVMTATTPTGTIVGPGIGYGTRYVIEVEFTDEPDVEANCSTNVLRAECKITRRMQDNRRGRRDKRNRPSFENPGPKVS